MTSKRTIKRIWSGWDEKVAAQVDVTIMKAGLKPIQTSPCTSADT